MSLSAGRPCTDGTDPLLCPSARADQDDAVVFGVVAGSVSEPTVTYLAEPQPMTSELAEAVVPLDPGEVFRIGASCQQSLCQHFDGGKCRLAERTVNMLPAAVSALPPCRLRPRCVWFRQEGRHA